MVTINICSSQEKQTFNVPHDDGEETEDVKASKDETGDQFSSNHEYKTHYYSTQHHFPCLLLQSSNTGCATSLK